MTRAYLVYILMASTLVVGVWVLLTYGDSLSAPKDLSGDWIVRWEQTLPPFAPDGRMHVDQSGRFFTVRFHGGPSLRLKLSKGPNGIREDQNLRMTLANERWILRCTGTVKQFSLEVRGPDLNVRGSAVRVGEQLAAAASTQPTGTANAR